MSIISKQIGWSQESNLLYEILKELDRLTKVMASSLKRTRLLTYTATGAEGDSFNVPGLAGKVVVAVFRTTYRRPITTVPTTSDDIQIVGTDLGANKGILSTTGDVGLEVGDSLVNGEKLDFLIWD